MRSFFNRVKCVLTVSVLILSSGAAFSQNGITFPGTTRLVPKDSIFLFICGGNSAMSGRDPSPDIVTNPRLWKFEISPANYDWLPAREPICVDAYNTLNTPRGGPTMPFMKRLAELYPSNYYFSIMQLSNSGWTLQGHFNSHAASIDTLLKYANLLKPNLTIAAYVTMLNLVEVQNSDTANYLQKVQAMVANVRSTLNMPNLPYIHAGYPVMAGSNPTGAKYDTSLAVAKSVMRQIAQIPTTITNSVVIPTDSLTICFTCTPAGYYSHYDRGGNLGWGNRTGDSVLARQIVPYPVSVSRQQHTMASASIPGLKKVLFDGSNWSVFCKAGKSFSLFTSNGRVFNGTSPASIRSLRLLPGIYFIREAR